MKAASVLHHTSTIKNRCPRVAKAVWEWWVGRELMTKWPAQICIPSLPVTEGDGNAKRKQNAFMHFCRKEGSMWICGS